MRVIQHNAILCCQMPFIASCIPDIQVIINNTAQGVWGGGGGMRGVKGPKQREKAMRAENL